MSRENYAVTFKTYIEPSDITREEWRRDDKLWGYRDQPAVTVRKNDEVVEQHWYDHGKRHRTFGPAVIMTSEEQYTEKYYCVGQLHRDDGPAVLMAAGADGPASYEEWRIYGKLHRDDGPAISESRGGRLTLHYYRDGLSHRDSGPGYIVRDIETGLNVEECWYRNDDLHREDGPADIERDPDTAQITRERWCREGRSHRTDGPAIIERDSRTGIATLEEWCMNGRTHRIGAPAIIIRDGDSGHILERLFFENGEEVAAPEIEDNSPQP